jgi:hypothetical protein
MIVAASRPAADRAASQQAVPDIAPAEASARIEWPAPAAGSAARAAG